MKPPPFGYARAASLADALGLLAAADDDARPLAGGQSLGPMLNLRVARPSRVIDVRRLPELRGTRIGPDGTLAIGASVTHAELEDGALPSGLGALGDYLRHVAAGIAYRAIRTRGTVGGSLAHADPAADWPTALAAVGARVSLAGREGARSVPVEDFVTGLFETRLAPGELVAGVVVPIDPAMRWGYRKQVRRAGEFAHALAACVLRAGGAGTAVWLGATGGAPLRVAVRLDGLPPGDAAACAALRARLLAALPDDLARGDDYARHLHAHNAALAIADALG